MLDPEQLRIYDPDTYMYHATRICVRNDSLNKLPPIIRNKRSIEKFFKRLEIIRTGLEKRLK